MKILLTDHVIILWHCQIKQKIFKIYNVVMKYLQIDCVTKFTNCFIIHL